MKGVLTGAILSFVAALVLVPIAIRVGRRWRVLDIPNARSSHVLPTPRIGGVGIIFGAFVPWLVLAWLGRIGSLTEILPLMLVCLVGGAVGLLEDLIQVRTLVRLLLYLSCATCAVLFGAWVTAFHVPGFGAVPLGAFGGFVFSVLFITWYTNLFNFMDGINGIAGGTCVVTMGALAMLFGREGVVGESLAAACIAAASAGFLVFNFPKASVFMGDGGAVFIGIAAGALSLRCVSLEIIGTHGVVLLMYPFVFDATFTLLMRMGNRERFWLPHRSHLYQRMCDIGLSHAQVTTIYVLLSVLCAVLGVLYGNLSSGVRVVAALMLLSLSFTGATWVIKKHDALPLERGDGKVGKR